MTLIAELRRTEVGAINSFSQAVSDAAVHRVVQTAPAATRQAPSRAGRGAPIHPGNYEQILADEDRYRALDVRVLSLDDMSEAIRPDRFTWHAGDVEITAPTEIDDR